MFDKFEKATDQTAQVQAAPQTDVSGSEILPEDMAGLILDMEIECQSESVTNELIVQLIQLYSRAIEHYEIMGSKKTKMFQYRMQALLARPLIQAVLNGKSSVLSHRKEMINRSKQEAVASNKEEVRKILLNSEIKAQSHKKSLAKWIGCQEEQLTQRIHRRKSMSNKSGRGSQNNLDDLDIQNQPALAAKLDLRLPFLDIGKGKNPKRVLI